MQDAQPYSSAMPQREIRAVYDDNTIRVYQAYPDIIADTALDRGTFVSPPFKMERMSWIKPSFLWMLYRSGWGLKDPGQKRILAIDISKEGFEWALAHSCLSHADRSADVLDWARKMHAAPVRVQWDPERDLHLRRLDYRTIQIGLSQVALQHYVHDWIRKITDVTPLTHEIHSLVQQGRLDEARIRLPVERPWHESPSA